MLISSLCLVAALIALSHSAPLVTPSDSTDSGIHPRHHRPASTTRRQSSIAGPAISSDFPDPAIIAFERDYYAFSTSSGGLNVPSAKSAVGDRWAVNNLDALPDPGIWSTGHDIWAPDVVQLVSSWQLSLLEVRLTREGRRHVRNVLQLTVSQQS
jgi:hypothetical protein